MKHNDVIVFDTETTGLLEPRAIKLELQPHMIEIYAGRFSQKGKLLDEVEFLIQPPIPIPDFITGITRIDNSMVAGCPVFAELYRPIVELFIGTRTMVAHNLPFDAGMLWVELSRMGKEFHFPWPPNWYCTIEHSMQIEGKMLKLGDLHKHATGTEHKEGAHRAKQDTLALHRCYEWMVKNEM